MTVQFDTGSAIVYVLTDKCVEHCNKSPKFKTEHSEKVVKEKYLDQFMEGTTEDLMNRIEYGYGSGYINGFAKTT